MPLPSAPTPKEHRQYVIHAEKYAGKWCDCYSCHKYRLTLIARKPFDMFLNYAKSQEK